MSWREVIWLLLITGCCLGQVTKRQNKLLSRKRRYLTFPKGSNLVFTMSGVKSVMVQVPTGINAVLECDVPFSLPSDTRLFRNYKRTQHSRQRREIFNQLSAALEGYGFDGDACIKRMICEARTYIPLKGKSLVRDLLSAVFKESGEELGHEYLSYCNGATFRQCDMPMFDFLIGGNQ